MRVVLCVLGVVLGSVVAVAALGQSPLKVAHCRANCIHELSLKENGKDCPQNAWCQSCWDQCERIGSGWMVACDEDSPCDLGCRLACRFHNQLAIQRPPVSVTRGQEVILLSRGSASWPAPTNTLPESGQGSPHVFVLMCRREDNSWTQVTQTLQLGCRLPEEPRACGAVRVMVVGPQGLVTVYSPAPALLQDAGLILRSVGKDIWNLQETLLKDSGKENHKNGSWSLREVSLIHQGVLVIAEVAWDAQLSSVYLVTWELAGGGLKGHLLTDSTCVTLSLWPDTVYQIQVQEVRQPERVSELLVLDTRRATPLPIPAVPVKTLGHPGFEGVAGVAAALLLFLAIALAVSSWMLSSHPSVEKADEELRETDHFKLFPPPVRLLVQTDVPDESRWPAASVNQV